MSRSPPIPPMGTWKKADFVSFGARLRQLRGGDSLASIAARCGVSPSFWSKLEHGLGIRPSGKVLSLICWEENVTQEWLLLGQGDLEPAEKRRMSSDLHRKQLATQVFLEVLDLISEVVWRYSFDPLAKQTFRQAMQEMNKSERATLEWLIIGKLDGTKFGVQQSAPGPSSRATCMTAIATVVEVVKQLTDSEEHREMAERMAKLLNCKPWIAISLMARFLLSQKLGLMPSLLQPRRQGV